MQKRGAPGDEDKDAKKRKLLEEIGNGHLQYFSSKDESFYELNAKHIPENVHQSAQKAFLSLFHHGCLFRDLVRLKGYKMESKPSALKDEKKDICCMDLYNVQLINYMDPQDMDYLKEEPYFDDFNQTHQHCVLAGFQPRFSSTHRVAECSRGTLKYIKSRCHTALENLCMNTDTEEASLNTLQRSVLYQTEEIHNEVEFEWLRQFWFQGKRYNKCTNFWMAAMTDLEDLWKQMEMMTSLVLKAIEKRSHAPEATCRILKTILPLLLVRQNLREEWRQ
ncbi:hypothetical protein GDO86_008465, partial [Hymenochirus boettgeri]